MTTAIKTDHLGASMRYRFARLSAGLSQTALGVALGGLAKTTISDWETGRTEPSFSKLVQLARVTGQPMEWFAEGVEVDLRARRDSNPQPSDLEPDPFWTPSRALLWLEISCSEYPNTETPQSYGVI